MMEYPQAIRFRNDVQAGDTAEMEMPIDGIPTRFAAAIIHDDEMTPLEYVDEDDAHYEAWRAGEFGYVGLVVGWEINEFQMGSDHAGSLWGIENWRDRASAECLAAIAHELIAEAADDVADLLEKAREALAAVKMAA